MDRGSYQLRKWCYDATSLIRFRPDRKKVFKELYDHLEDRRDSLMEQGLSLEEANEKTLAAMGSATELAPELEAIHNPFWGYVLRGCKIALVVLLCLSILPCWNYFKSLNLKDKPDWHGFDVYDSASYAADTGRTLLHLSRPNKSFSYRGNRFTVTDAVVCALPTQQNPQGRRMLYILMDQTSLLPWTEHEQYTWVLSPDVSSAFIARDSLGNVYPSTYTQTSEDAATLGSYGVQSGVFRFTHEFWIGDFPAEADWVELCYLREGQNFVLRINL